MAESVDVSIRETRGKRPARHMRSAGQVPAVLYGHGKKVVSLAAPKDQLMAAIRHGTKLVKLSGAATDNALIREAQWDPFGVQLLHVDFMRVTAKERIRVEVAIELRGDAPGTKEGGILEQVLREIEIEVVATSIPDRLHVNVNDLHLGKSITVEEIEDLPAGAKLLVDKAAVVVHCVQPAEEVEDIEAPTEGVEPELIGGKPEEEPES